MKKIEKKKVIREKTLTALDKIFAKEYPSGRVTVWGNRFDAFVECKGFSGPSKRVEKILAGLNVKIIEQQWSEGSDYTGYYYWIAE